jgi:uncharacterized metal-binding protein/predicted Fe-Mo cluster-binding NifX family protein
MRYGIPLVGGRVAPRCIFAEAVLIVDQQRGRPPVERKAFMDNHGLLDLAKVLSEQDVDILVCGGINQEERDYLKSRGLEVIENVAGPVGALLDAVRTGALYSGFGLAVEHRQEESSAEGIVRYASDSPVDCLACTDRKCLRGERCDIAFPEVLASALDHETDRILDASFDIASEHERTLCRLSELIYFCLEMQYRRIGVAYCLDLQEPAETLVRVLRRHFTVYPICCKVGGVPFPEQDLLPQSARINRRTPPQNVICNPLGQAEVLNRLRTDINVLVGICMGADCIISRTSLAPVTTLFVKDKSLANNPIGAVYSEYYLKEAIGASSTRSSGR